MWEHLFAQSKNTRSSELMIYIHHWVRLSTTAKKPSEPSFIGNTFITSPPTTYSLCSRHIFLTCSSFSCLSRLHVMQSSLPCLERYFIALPTICYCKRTLDFIQDYPNLSFMSGFLLSVPVPVHGASTITQSIFPAATLANASSFEWNCTLVTPARANLLLAFPRATSLG